MAPRLRALLVIAVALGVPFSVVACKDAAAPLPAAPSASGSGIAESKGEPAPANGSAAAADAKGAASVAASATPNAPSPKQLTSAACQAIVAEADAGFRAALAKTKTACAKDADCTQERATCLPGCGGSAFAAKDKDAYTKTAAAPLAQCEKFNEGACMTALALPMPSCPMYVPVCDKGACVSKMKLK